MQAVYGLDKSKGLDIILHTPGGNTAATESIVTYLRSLFGNDILYAGKQLEHSDNTKRKNIRFTINRIIAVEGQEWRNCILYERK